MGQLMRIVSQRELGAGVVRFELDRSITGTDHEAYTSSPDASSVRLCDVLAARLFAVGDVRSIHMFSNAVSVTLGSDFEHIDPHELGQLQTVIEQLFIYYQPGVLPTPV